VISFIRSADPVEIIKQQQDKPKHHDQGNGVDLFHDPNSTVLDSVDVVAKFCVALVLPVVRAKFVIPA
jgi:hypothetical protein